MSDDPLSKRERQKQRKAAKREVERAEQTKARRKRLGMTVLVGVVVAGLIGAAVARVVLNRQAVAAREEEVAAELETFGCDEIADLPDQGAGHIDTTPEALVAAAPDMLYPDRPTSSGQHVGQVVRTGVYDVGIDERLTTHNLEHGYIVYWYAEDAPSEEVTALKDWAQGRIDDGFPKVVVSPWVGESLPDDKNFASVAWGHRQVCDQFDPDVFQVMIDRYHGTQGDAPPNEKGIAAHVSDDAPGVLVPEDEPLLFPPLGEATGGGEAVEDGGGTPAGTAPATDPGTAPATDTGTAPATDGGTAPATDAEGT